MKNKTSLPMGTRVIVIHAPAFGHLLRMDCEIDPGAGYGISVKCTEQSIPESHRYAAAGNSRTLVVNGDTDQLTQQFTATAFQSLQKDPNSHARLMRVLTEPTWSVADASEIARRVIRIVSQARMSADTISPECDCIHLTDGHIEWLNKAIATTILGRPDKK